MAATATAPASTGSAVAAPAAAPTTPATPSKGVSSGAFDIEAPPEDNEILDGLEKDGSEPAHKAGSAIPSKKKPEVKPAPQKESAPAQAEGEDTQEEAEDLIYTELGFCGCGLPEQALKLVKLLLTILDYSYGKEEKNFTWDQKDRWLKKLLPYDGIYYLVLYYLDSKGYTDHGSGIGGCWLNPKGKEFLTLLRSINILPLEGKEDTD